MSVVIGVDLGTSNIKVVAASQEGNVQYRHSLPCTLLQPTAETAEHDPEHILDLVTDLLKQAFAAIGPLTVAAVSFSAAMHSVIAVDAQGNCLTNAWLWGDNRAVEQEQMFKAKGIADQLYRETAVPLHPALPICKIAWLKQELPVLFRQTHKFISIKEFIFLRYFGVYKVDHSIAAASGLQDIHQLQWSTTALAAAGITASHLSEIVGVDHCENQLLPWAADALNLRISLPFVMGSSDGCLANIGTGVLNETTAALTIGTSGAVRITSAQQYLSAHAALFCYPVTQNLFITGGPISNGGYVMEWLAENLLQFDLAQKKSYDELLELAFSVEPGAEQLIFLPYLRGDRAPIWDAKARGVFFGFNSLHTREHMVRAVLEGINYALYDVFCTMEALHEKVEAIHVSGGFIRSGKWVQLLADVFNKKIIVTDIADASAMGAIYTGFFAIGETASITASAGLKSKGMHYLPDPEKHEIYQKNFKIFRSVYKALKPEFHKLSM